MSLINKQRIISSGSKFLVDENEVIFFLLWHFGDVFMSTALLPELVSRHNKKLTFVTTSSCVTILENNPYIDKILILDLEIPKIVNLEHYEMTQKLSHKYFPNNAVYNLHFPIYIPKIYFLKIKLWAKAHNLDFPIFLRNSNFHLVECWAKSIGIEKSLSKLKPSYFPIQNSDHKFKFDHFFVLGNGGSVRIIHWPKKNFTKFVEIMQNRFPEIHLVQLGSERDPLIDGVEDLRGKTTIEESYHLLKKSKGCLTNDSFLAFLASASGSPTFIVYGNQNPNHFRPFGHPDIFVFGGNFRCTPCMRDWCLLTFGLTTCLAFPSVKEVFEKVESILENK